MDNKNKYLNKYKYRAAPMPRRYEKGVIYWKERYPRDHNNRHRNSVRRSQYNVPQRKRYTQYGREKYPTSGEKSPSPVPGSEEYMVKKVKATSALIMRQLLTPDELLPQGITNNCDINKFQKNCSNHSEECQQGSNVISKSLDKVDDCLNSKNSKNTYSVEQIYNKIMSHIGKLNDGKKKNIINSKQTGYDMAVQHLVTQKRLEISRTLRMMCSDANVSDGDEFYDIINTVIPDIGISLEDLPKELIEELRNSFDVGFRSVEENLTGNLSPSVGDEDTFDFDSLDHTCHIKKEPDDAINLLNIVDSEFRALEDIKDESIDTGTIKEEPDSMLCEPVNEEQICDGNNVSDPSEEHIPNNFSQVQACDTFTQTEPINMLLSNSLPDSFDQPPKDIGEAVARMLEVDKMISELTTYRQNLFAHFVNGSSHDLEDSQEKVRHDGCSLIGQKRKCDESQNVLVVKSKHDINGEVKKKRQKIDVVDEKVLVTEVCGNILAGGTESGKLYLYDLSGFTSTRVVTVSNSPITAFTFVKEQKSLSIIVTSYDNSIRMYDSSNLKLVRKVNTDVSIQCMDQRWGYVFMGTQTGYLLRYSLKKGDVEFEEKFLEDCILTLKATLEGARKVLLIGAAKSPVCIRDAITGLHLRTLAHNALTCSVYSIIVERGIIYCGTDNHVHAFSFHEGTTLKVLKAEDSKQINCMKLLGKLLFAGCENGNIYVYDIVKNTKIGCIEGPGGSVLCIAVLDEQIVVGTPFFFKSLPIPETILSYRPQE